MGEGKYKKPPGLKKNKGSKLEKEMKNQETPN